jgi:hypothetical protein
VKKPAAEGSVRLPQPLLIGLVCIFFLSAGSMASAQTVESALGKSTYSQSHKSAITSFFTGIEQDGIPIELLLPKLEEGIAKGVPAPRVLDVLAREAESLGEARALILRVPGGRRLLSDRASWARTANLLAGDFSQEEIETLIGLSVSRVEVFRPATYLYAALTDWGMVEDSALELVAALLDSSISPDSYMGVMDLLAAGRRRRIAPEELVQRIREHLDHATTIEELRKWIY